MPPFPPYLPPFTTETSVTPETGKQDRLEIEIGGWEVTAFSREEQDAIFRRLGPPPPTMRGRRLRQDHGDAYGWIFNAMNINTDSPKRKVDVRMSPLELENDQQERRIIPPPLFEGSCQWEIKDGHGQDLTETHDPSALDAPESLRKLHAKLKLILNPTRTHRHSPLPRQLPEAMQRQNSTPAPFGEFSFDDADNWLPLFGRRQALLTPEKWQQHLQHCLASAEGAFEQELTRVCGFNGNPVERGRQTYNVKEVETYWEWGSPAPIKLVEDLVPLVETFSSQFQAVRTYNSMELERRKAKNLRILHIQTAPGEWLKIYAKTNLRIRIEVTHKLVGKKDRFQFPRERDTLGVVRRTSAHTFQSRAGVQEFLGRLQNRAAFIVNKFLTHVREHAQVVPSHISAFDALFRVARAIPNDEGMAVALLSQLLQGRGIRAGGNEAKQRAIAALKAADIIEPSGRNLYVPTADFRHAFEMLRQHASFPILVDRQDAEPSNGA